MVTIVSLFVVLLTLFLSIYRRSYGLCSFLACRILIPETVRFTDSLSLNTANIIVVFLCYIFFEYKKKRLALFKDYYIKTLLIFIVWAAITIPFSSYGDLRFQIMQILQFMMTEVLPSVLAICILKDKKEIFSFTKVLITSTIICCLYGVVSYLSKSNIIVQAFTGSTVEFSWKGVSTSATFVSSNALGYFATMTLPLFIFLLNTDKRGKRILTFSILLLIAMIFMCKKKTALITMILFFLLLFLGRLDKKKLKTFFISLPVILIALIFIYSIPSFGQFANYLTNAMLFWNNNAVTGLSKVDLGSTLGMRLKQILYPFIEIKDNLLFGHGFGWCRYYIINSKYGYHPIMYGFETILAKAICEFGVFGYLPYFWLFFRSYKYGKNDTPYKKSAYYVLMYIATVTIMAVGTGLDYFWLFFISIVLMNKHNALKREIL